MRANGELAGVRVVAHKETPGLGDYIELIFEEFVELQKHLNDLTEAEAEELAALPPLSRPARLVAA